MPENQNTPEEQLRLNNLAAQLTDILSEQSNIQSKMSNTTTNMVAGVQRLVQKWEEGETLSRRQLGWMTGAVNQIQSASRELARGNKFQAAANDLLKANKEVFKTLSADQQATFSELWRMSNDLSVSETDRAMASKKALIILQDQEKVLKIQNEYLSEYVGWVDEAKEKWKKITAQIGAVLKSPWTAGLVAVGILIKKFEKWKEAIGDVKKDLGLSVTQTAKATGTITAATAQAALWGADVKDVSEAYKAIADESGDISKATAHHVAQAAKYMKLTGLSADEVVKIQETFNEMPGATAEFSDDMMQFATDMSRANNVPLAKVMKDIGNNTETFATFGKEGAKNLIAASTMATKLGISMSEITKAADGLLDIESSLNAEMEASVLLGRDINLDKARQAALAGDYKTLTQEIASNVGSAAEWDKMDMIQKKALADSLSMQVSEVGKIVNNQDKLKGMTDDQLKNYYEQGQALDQQLDAGSGILSNLTLENILLGVALIRMLGIGKAAKGVTNFLSNSAGLAGKLGNKLKGFAGKFTGGGGTPPPTPPPGGDTGAGGGMVKGLVEAFKKIEYKDIIKFTAIAAAISVSLIMLIPALKMFADVPWEGMAKGMVALIGLGLGMKIMGKMTGDVLKGSFAMLIVAAALIPAAYAFTLIAGVPVENILAFALVLPMIGLAFALIGNIAGNIMMGSVALLIAAVALIPAAYAFSLIKDVPVENIIAFSIVLPLLGLAMAGLGFLLPFIAAGALAVAAMGGGLLVFSLAVGAMKDMPTDKIMALVDILPALAGTFTIVGLLSPFIVLGSLALVSLGFGLTVFSLAASYMQDVPIDKIMALVDILPALAGTFTILGIASPFIVLGSLAIMTMAGSIGLLGMSLASVGDGLQLMPILATSMTELVANTGGIFALAGAFGTLAMSITGLAGSLLLLAPMIPILAAANALGVNVGGNETATAETTTAPAGNEAILAKLDELIAAVQQGATIQMDGAQVGKAVVKFVNLNTGSPAAGRQLLG